MAPRVVVVGLGPGDPGDLSAAAAAAIAATPVRYLRTRRHPSAAAVGDAVAFDDVYERAASMDEVYSTITARLAEAAARHGEVLYAVPGSPLVAERTVQLLRADPALDVTVVASLSFLDLAWARLGVDPVAAGVRIVDGHRFAGEAAGSTGPLLVAQCESRFILSEIKLSVERPPPAGAVVLQRLGLPDEAVVPLDWADLDRGVEPDHLTCVWIPALGAPVAGETTRLAELVRVLRERCPWDAAQTHASLRTHALEEAYEVVDAITALDPDDPATWAHFEEELGDLLFQVVLHARLAEEAGEFALADVARTVHDKLVRRHPHVFGEGADAAGDVAGLDRAWERGKQAEAGRSSVTDGIPAALPALAQAAKLQRRAAAVGLDWPDAGPVWEAVAGELAELREAAQGGSSVAVEAELGDVLFSVVNLGRHLGVDPELALRGASGRFASRVRGVEGLAAEAGLDADGLAALPPEELDGLWQGAKRPRR